MTFGEKLSRLRKEFNYTQEQLADRLGVSRQSISKWESDLAYPETDKLIELGKHFDCSMDYLLKEEITEKNGSSVSAFQETIGAVSKKVLSEKNKHRTRKLVKWLGISAAVVLAVDLISFVVAVLWYL